MEISSFIIITMVNNIAPYFETVIPNYVIYLPAKKQKFDLPNIIDDDSEVAYIT